MSKFYDEIDKYFEKDIRAIELHAFAEYAKAQQTLLESLETMRSKYGPGPVPYVQLLEEQRLMNIYSQIDEEMNRLVGVVRSDSLDAMNIGAEYGFMGTTYAMERDLKSTIGYDMVDTARIEKLIAMDPTGIPLSERLYGPLLSKMSSGVKSTVLMGLTQGLSNKEMAKMLSSSMATSYAHAKTIIRTESGRLRSLTQQDAYKYATDNGVYLQKKWIARLDKRTRRSHQDMDAQIVEVDEEFTSVRGYTTPQPRLFGIPGEDINCRCTTVAIVNGVDPSKARRDGLTKEIVNVKDYKSWLKKYHPDDYAKLYPKATPKPRVPKPKAVVPTKVADAMAVLRSKIDTFHDANPTWKKISQKVKDEFPIVMGKWDARTTTFYSKYSAFFRDSNYKGGAGFYSPKLKTVAMDMMDNDWEKAMGLGANGAWKTKFHEEFHQLGHLMMREAEFNKLYIGSGGRNLLDIMDPKMAVGRAVKDAMNKDVLNFLNARVDFYNRTFRSKPGKVHAEYLTSLTSITDEQKKIIVNAMKSEFPDAKSRAMVSTMTDAIGNATRDELNLYTKGFWGHEPPYGLLRDMGPAELWADYGGLKLHPYQQQYNLFTAQFPNAVAVLDPLFEKVMDTIIAKY